MITLHSEYQCVYYAKSCVVSNVQSKWAGRLIPAAVIKAGLAESSVSALVKALPLGAAALEKVPGITPQIIAAAGAAVQETYVHALKVTAMSSLSFGILALIACYLCNDIGHKVIFVEFPYCDNPMLTTTSIDEFEN